MGLFPAGYAEALPGALFSSLHSEPHSKLFMILIRRDNFEEEVIAEKKPVLILCMPMDEELTNQKRVIEEISTTYGERLKTGLLHEDFIEVFKKNYRIGGTPTFLILVEGEERGRMLGLADHKTLTEWLFVYVSQNE